MEKTYLISSVCISKNGSMIWNHTDKANLTMKNFSDEDLKNYLSKYQMKHYMLIMFIKLKGGKKFIFKY